MLYHALRTVLFSLSLSLLSMSCVAQADFGTSRSKLLARASPSSSYWEQNIQRRGTVPFNTNSTYKIFRNVMDYGAKGDGRTDDTTAINLAISDGNRCGSGCDSSTTTPAIIYFPHGTYLITKPIIMYYYTQMIGDATNLPTIKGNASFYGIGLLDSDVYYPYGYNWYTNQNNFYRQVRNFILDLTAMPPSYGAGIHWQVAQATSLQNIVFNMHVGGTDNKQQGIFMDNGSGGWMGDMIFNGGNICMFMGNQQFTVRNVTFNNCQTAVYQNWGWVWLYKHLDFNNCGIGIDMSNGGSVQTVGSVILQDSTFNNVQQAVVTSWDQDTAPVSGGTFVADNVDFRQATKAISYPNGTVILSGGSIVDSFIQGRAYTTYFTTEIIDNKTCLEPGANGMRIQRQVGAPVKPSVLLDGDGRVAERYKPQYEGEPISSFISVKGYGAKGDGDTDDTAAIQAVLDSATIDDIVYFDHGAYLISDTLQISPDTRITGECWPMIMALGTAFDDKNNPKPVWRVGEPGDTGIVEMSDMVFETKGPAPGAILVEWNLAGTSPGDAGMWDVHWRVGGTAGTLLQSDTCTKDPSVAHNADPDCVGAFMLLHITSEASVYMENNWGWVSDHELDLPDHNQIDIYNGRGMLVESTKGVWILGTGFEHSMLYNYNFVNSNNVYVAVAQSETAYMQDNPNSIDPFAPVARYSDPDFGNCFQAICYKTMGVRVFNSNNFLAYGMGLYSFFNNYDQGCLLTESCQEFMVAVDNSSEIYMYALSTKAALNMIEIDGVAVIPEEPNHNTFCQTVALFEEP